LRNETSKSSVRSKSTKALRVLILFPRTRVRLHASGPLRQMSRLLSTAAWSLSSNGGYWSFWVYNNGTYLLLLLVEINWGRDMTIRCVYWYFFLCLLGWVEVGSTRSTHWVLVWCLKMSVTTCRTYLRVVGRIFRRISFRCWNVAFRVLLSPIHRDYIVWIMYGEWVIDEESLSIVLVAILPVILYACAIVSFCHAYSRFHVKSSILDKNILRHWRWPQRLIDRRNGTSVSDCDSIHRNSSN
jgi:hypothetical protein